MVFFVCGAFLFFAPPALSQIVINPDLVTPYSSKLENKARIEKPFLAQFKKEGHSLFYLATKHSTSRSSKTFRLIKQVFDENTLNAVVIEGYPQRDGFNPKRYIAFSKRMCGSGDFCEGAEPAYTALLALEKNIPFIGGEPADTEVLTRVVQAGYTAEDLVLFYFVRQVPQLKMERRLKAERLHELFDEYLVNQGQKLGAAFPDGLTFERFKKWYLEKNGKPFALPIEREEVSPKLQGKLFTQRISGVVDIVRNRFMVELLARLLNDRKNVLIVFGGSHFLSHWEALEEALGEATISSGR